MENLLEETQEQAAKAVNEMLEKPIASLPHPSFLSGKHVLVYNTGGSSNLPWRGEAFTKGTDPSGYLRMAHNDYKEIIESFIEQYGQPDSLYVFNSRAAAKAVFPGWFKWMK